MTTAMAALSCRRMVAVIVALAFFLGVSPYSAMAQDSKDLHVFKILQNETQFSMFYKALVDTKEIYNVEGRTLINGSQLLLFAPTNGAFSDALRSGVLECLQTPKGKALFMNFLEYLQVNVPISAISPRVESVKDLVSVTREGKIYAVSGEPILVTEEANGVVSITGDDLQEKLAIQKVRVTDPTVTLIPLEESVLVSAATGDSILSTCFGDSQASTSSPSPAATTAKAAGSAPGSAPGRAPGSSQAVASGRSRKLSMMFLN